MRLEDLVARRAEENPRAVAIRSHDQHLSYGALHVLSNRIAHALLGLGVAPHTRVALWLDKSIECVAAMQAVLRLGAAYVPLDPASPPRRILRMVEDCAPTAMVTTRARAGALDDIAGARSSVPCLVVDGTWRGLSWDEVQSGPSHAPLCADQAATLGERDLAYILYTSGSTGTPKGVCISHENALAFVAWAARAIDASERDRFSNHAPFHFDISVFDLYVAFLVGACVSLVPRLISYLPPRLVDFCSEHEITVWYSVPSAVIMMMEDGGLLTRPGIEPRVLIFAGEPFPVSQLARLRDHWQSARFFNFYGPTETNVCTAYEVRPGDLDGRTNVPIGTAASGDRVWLEDDTGAAPPAGEEGEIVVAGPTVMLGYFGHEPQGDAPYRTGDIARIGPSGDIEFVGRRDHMVKVHGYRVELGEIENVLLGHPAIRAAAVLVHGNGRYAQLVAFLVARSDAQPSLLAIKQHCAHELPAYAIVARVHWLAALPRTGNGKLDREALIARLNA